MASADVQEVRFQNFDFRGRFITILRLRRLAFHKFPDVKIGSSLQPQQHCHHGRISSSAGRGLSSLKKVRQTLQIPGRNEHVLAAAATAGHTYVLFKLPW